MEYTPRSIEQIIERQVRLWELQREAAMKRQAPPEPWPVITVSREFGARGAALARAIGERTGFSVWNNELVHEIAQETGAYEAILASLEEQHRNAIEEAIRGALVGSVYTGSDYLQALMRVIYGLAAHGSAVIVGRGANYILNPARILRVRVVCPLEQRVHQYAEREGLPIKKARQTIERMDRERAEFMRHHYRRDVTDPAEYDLVLNSGSLAEPTMVDLTLLAYERKLHRRPPSRA